jgi:polysaccharide biosynthesis transport protein
VQPTEGLSVSRRALDVEDYIDILRRHKGWIFGPFLLCVVASVVGVFLWPDSYQSQAVVMIRPQQIPESMVQSTFNQHMYDRIQSIQQTIESRAVLTTMINNFGLYQRERNREPIDDVIDEMKKQIKITMIASAADAGNGRVIPAFAVTFTYEDRHKAQMVVNDLVGRFMDENQRYQTSATSETTQFMKDEMDQAKKSLDDTESKLASFREQHNGQLPDQMQSNMQSLTAIQSQMAMYDAAISRANEDKLQLENNYRIIQGQIADLKKTPVGQDAVAVAHRNEKLTEAEREVQSLEDQLRVLRQRYTETYPDIKAAEGRLKIAQDKRDALLKQDTDEKQADDKKAATSPKALNPVVQKEIRDMEVRASQTQSAIEAKNLEIDNANKAMKRASDMIKTLTSHIESVPLGEKEYDDLLRDQMVKREQYVQLQDRLEKAKMSEEMQYRNQGERLEIVDPASLPLTPTQPNRPMVIALGAGLGMVLGLVMAGAREMKDTALKNLKDVRAYTQMAILGSIPLLENDFVVRRRKRLSWLGWTTACLAAIVIMAGSIVYYFTVKSGG